MSDDALIEALKSIRAIVEKALARKTPPRTGKAKSRAESSTKDSSALPSHILNLRDSGFLKQPKTPVEVHEKLRSTYHCDPNRVAVALHRLHKKRALRKTSKTSEKRKQVAYVW